ncbi:MAG: DUF4405 domain-containing protein [Acidobacteriota bacterium]|jgi:hypothetical protein
MSGTKFNKRGLVSFLTLFGFLIMALTGLVLYAMPEGRVAYWILWEFAGLSKTGWGNIHVLSSILFIVAGIFHIYFNWRPLLQYFKSKVHEGIGLRRELLIASLLSVFIVVSSIRPFPPLSYLLDFKDWMKAAWVEEADYEPPFGHAELMPLGTFCKKMDIDLDAAILELHSAGIHFDHNRETLEEIARANAVSPMELYLLIKKFEPAPGALDSYTPESIEVEFSGTGIGNRTIETICSTLGLDIGLASSRLKKAGLSDDMDQTVKSLAGSADSQPIEILKVLLIEGYEFEKTGN